MYLYVFLWIPHDTELLEVIIIKADAGEWLCKTGRCTMHTLEQLVILVTRDYDETSLKSE